VASGSGALQDLVRAMETFVGCPIIRLHHTKREGGNFGHCQGELEEGLVRTERRKERDDMNGRGWDPIGQMTWGGRPGHGGFAKSIGARAENIAFFCSVCVALYESGEYRTQIQAQFEGQSWDWVGNG